MTHRALSLFAAAVAWFPGEMFAAEVAAPAAPAPGLRIYVAPNGNDAWTGSLAAPNAAGDDGPLASLERARDAIRKARGANSNTGLPERAVVTVRGGVYYLGGPLLLEAQDSRVTYTNEAGERPTLVGGKRITQFTPYKGSILQSDLAAQGFKSPTFQQLIYNGKRQTLARYPNADAAQPYLGGYAYVAGERVPMGEDIPGESRRTFHAEPADLHPWAHPELGEVVIFPRYNWWNDIIHIASVDAGEHAITLASDASFALRPGDRYYVRNLLEELDAPGEWYLDREHAIVYFWPPGPVENALVYAPTLENLVQMRDAAEIVIHGFTLEGSELRGVVVENSAKCVIASNTVRNVGGRADGEAAAVTVNGGSGNGVVGNDIYEVGSHGILLAGGDRKTLQAAGNYAENNQIHHTGVFYKQGTGIILDGVGNRASRNLIHDTPRFAVFIKGNDAIVELNHIHDVNLETCDTGAIYCRGADWIASRGSSIRFNYIHDSIGLGQENGKWITDYYAHGIYLDDQAADIQVYGNLLVRCSDALMHLHGAMNNVIENNVFVAGAHEQMKLTGSPMDATSSFTKQLPEMTKGYEQYVSLPAWKKYSGFAQPPKDAVPLANNRIARNIFYYKDPASKFAKTYLVPNKSFVCDANVIFHFGQPLLVGPENVAPREQWKAWQKLGFDTHSVIEDPLFVDPARQDYRLRFNSPAFKLGFKALPVEKIGPYQDPLRASWPIDDPPKAQRGAL